MVRNPLGTPKEVNMDMIKGADLIEKSSGTRYQYVASRIRPSDKVEVADLKMVKTNHHISVPVMDIERLFLVTLPVESVKSVKYPKPIVVSTPSLKPITATGDGSGLFPYANYTD